jgi:hypothetical protein
MSPSPRRFILACLLVAGDVLPVLGQGAPTAGSFCFSDAAAPVVYFSAAFDTKLNPNVGNNAHPISREFYAYLKARYGFSSNSNYPMSCGFYSSTVLAEAGRAEIEGRMRREERKVVEVDWKYLPDEAAATASFNRPAGDRNMLPAPPADHGFCVAGPFDGPLYVSDVFDAVAPVSIAQWNITFLRFLGGKYGYKGNIQCENGPLDVSRRVLKAAADGARIAGRKIVETGWKYDADVTSAPAPRVDADREPPRPAAAAPNASTDARKLAGKEAPAVLAYCQKDRTLSVVFDCLRVQQAVISYRLAHADTSTPEPLASLFTGDKLDCTKCLDNYRQAAWAKRQALSQRMKAPVATCVSKEFVAKLRAKPYPNRVQEHFDAAVAACR